MLATCVAVFAFTSRTRGSFIADTIGTTAVVASRATTTETVETLTFHAMKTNTDVTAQAYFASTAAAAASTATAILVPIVAWVTIVAFTAFVFSFVTIIDILSSIKPTKHGISSIMAKR